MKATCNQFLDDFPGARADCTRRRASGNHCHDCPDNPLRQPFGFTLEPLEWGNRQSEMTIKITREPQKEYGFVHPIFIRQP